jgi:hypothetical protein
LLSIMKTLVNLQNPRSRVSTTCDSGWVTHSYSKSMAIPHADHLPTLSQVGFASKSPKSHLETVSTVRGSGWVAVPKCEIAIDYEYERDVLTFGARPWFRIISVRAF